MVAASMCGHGRTLPVAARVGQQWRQTLAVQVPILRQTAQLDEGGMWIGLLIGVSGSQRAI